MGRAHGAAQPFARPAAVALGLLDVGHEGAEAGLGLAGALASTLSGLPPLSMTWVTGKLSPCPPRTDHAWDERTRCPWCSGSIACAVPGQLSATFKRSNLGRFGPRFPSVSPPGMAGSNGQS